MKIRVFPPLVFVWPSKQFLAFSQFIWPSDVLNIQNQSNLSYFEAILPLKLFLLQIWQSVRLNRLSFVSRFEFRARQNVN